MINPKISLIISTYGRSIELDELLESLVNQDVEISVFEVIIVDQNDKIILDDIVKRYASSLDLKHHKVNFKGLAKAKNYGLNCAIGEIVTFPDDDCKYYPNTLSSMLNFFKENPGLTVTYGRLYDRDRQKNIMREWPKKEKKITYSNYHYTYSAVTIFTFNKSLKFNEEFGVGTKYGVGEEIDYLLRSLKNKKAGIFTPSIDIWHPELNPYTMTEEKAFSYAYGYGAIMRKHISIRTFAHFLTSCLFQLFELIKAALLFNKHKIRKRYLALKGRLLGFIRFK